MAIRILEVSKGSLAELSGMQPGDSILKINAEDVLDEIDYLLQEAFDSPADFSRIRSAATDKKCTLKFWVAGVSSWSSLCTNVGSPELNCGLENVTLSLLKKDDFDSFEIGDYFNMVVKCFELAIMSSSKYQFIDKNCIIKDINSNYLLYRMIHTIMNFGLNYQMTM